MKTFILFLIICLAGCKAPDQKNRSFTRAWYQSNTDKDGQQLYINSKPIDSETTRITGYSFRRIGDINHFQRDSSFILYLTKDKVVSFFGDEFNLPWLFAKPQNVDYSSVHVLRNDSLLFVNNRMFSPLEKAPIAQTFKDLLFVEHNNYFYRLKNGDSSVTIRLFEGPSKSESSIDVDMNFFAGSEIVTNPSSYLDINHDSTRFKLIGFGESNSLDYKKYNKMYFVQQTDFDRYFQKF
jgi:hypothetical protein